MIVDAHTHIFARMNGRIGKGSVVPLPGGKVRIGDDEVIDFFPPTAREMRFAPDTLLAHMDQAGVDRAVLLQGPFYGEMNDYVQQAMFQWPDRFTGAAYLDLWSADPQKEYRHVVDDFGFQIIKLELSERTGLCGLHLDLRLNDPKLDWFWEEADQQRLVVVLDLGHVGGQAYQTQALDQVVKAHAALRIVIAHLAQPPLGTPDDKRLDQLWTEQVCLARHPSVWLDTASLPNYAVAVGEDYPYPGACRYLRRAIELVSAEKILWGSDIPGTLLHNTYPQLLSFLTKHCEFLSESDRAKILGVNAMAVYFPEECR